MKQCRASGGRDTDALPLSDNSKNFIAQATRIFVVCIKMITWLTVFLLIFINDDSDYLFLLIIQAVSHSPRLHLAAWEQPHRTSQLRLLLPCGAGP